MQHLPEVDQQNAEMLAIARTILAVATDPKCRFSVPIIAERAGLSEHRVKEVLASSLYRDMFRQGAQDLFQHALFKSVSVLEEIVGSEKEKSKVRIMAADTIGRIYDAITKRAMRDPDNPADNELNDWKERQRQLQRNKLRVESSA